MDPSVNGPQLFLPRGGPGLTNSIFALAVNPRNLQSAWTNPVAYKKLTAPTRSGTTHDRTAVRFGIPVSRSAVQQYNSTWIKDVTKNKAFWSTAGTPQLLSSNTSAGKGDRREKQR